MKSMAKLLIALGVVIVLIAFNMDVTIDGAKIVNLNMVSERQNLLIVGCVTFISGIILFAASGNNKPAQTDFPKVPKKSEIVSLLFKFKTIIIAIWFFQDAGGKLIFASSIMAAICIALSWQYVELFGANGSSILVSRKYIEIKNLVAIIIIWAYPMRVVLSQSIANMKLMGVCAAISIAWIIWVFNSFYYFHNFVSQRSGLSVDILPKMGFGMILAATASIFFASGVAVKLLSSKRR